MLFAPMVLLFTLQIHSSSLFVGTNFCFTSCTSLFYNLALPPCFFFLVGLSLHHFTSSRTSTITNLAPLHTLFTLILGLFYILLAAPPPLINTPHLLHVPLPNHSCTLIICFPLSSFLIKLFLFLLFYFVLLFFYFVYYYFFFFLFLFLYLKITKNYKK